LSSESLRTNREDDRRDARVELREIAAKESLHVREQFFCGFWRRNPRWEAEFARRIGVSQGHFSYIERGEKEIGADILLRISQEFEKSIEWLLTGKE
jgi:transcriptional regulator with XRE-family HTH domain